MDPIIGSPETAAAGNGGLIKDTTTATFARDVLEDSMNVPVIVDFWAPWCGPCKQLGPMIEKAVTAAAGAVKLVKIDIDQHPEIAQQMRVQSIPAVFAFFQGRPVDGFVGAVPESQIKAFIDKLASLGGRAPGAQGLDDVLAQAEQALQAGDSETAVALYTEVLQVDQRNVKAAAGLAQCLLAEGDHDSAKQIIDSLDEEAAKDPAVTAVRAALDLAAEAQESVGQLASLEATVAAAPEDKQARYDLAVAQFAAGQPEAACDNLLAIIKADRAWNEEAARKQLLKIFEALGPTHELTVSSRRQLSSILFS